MTVVFMGVVDYDVTFVSFWEVLGCIRWEDIENDKHFDNWEVGCSSYNCLKES